MLKFFTVAIAALALSAPIAAPLAALAQDVPSYAQQGPPPPEDAPKLGITAMQVWVHESASASSRKLGYLRLGALHLRLAHGHVD